MKSSNFNPEFIPIIKDASRAPSGHNTQPWIFEVAESQIIIRPNFARRLKVVDFDDHALFISLGCALENLILSAKSHQFSPKVTMNFTNRKDEIIVDLIKSDNEKKDDLYEFIFTRQCTRSEYDPELIDQSLLDKLMKEGVREEVEIMLFTDRGKIKELTPFIIEGSNLQFSNKYFVDELVSWIRFNEKAAEKTGDGLWASCTGAPNVPEFMGRIVLKNFTSAKSEAKRWRKLIDKSVGFALFIVKENSKENWVKLGQSFERFGLKATQLNIKHAHVNMPCEEITVRQKLIQHLKISNGKQPLLLIRFGYAEGMPYSFRRPWEEMLA